MLKKRNLALAAAVWMAVAGVGFVNSAHASEVETTNDSIQNFNLAEVVVFGQRYIAGEFVRATSNVGILGERDMMHTPLSVTTLSEKAIGNFMNSTEGLSASLGLVPSVRKNSDNAVDTVSIRGFGDSGRGFMVNGIPGMQAMTRQSTNYIDSVDIIEGPSSGIKGAGATMNIGGTVNINSKKAIKGEEIRKIGLKYHSRGAHEEYVDIGQRFGEDERYGVRVIATNTNGERSVKGWDLEQRSIYVNLDQETEKSKTNFMVGYTYTDSQGRPYGFKIGKNVSILPSAPSGDAQLNPDWRRDKNTNFVVTLNHEQELNSNMSAFLNAGHFKQDWYYYTGFDKTIINNDGDYTATSDNWSLLDKRDYVQLGLKGNFHTGELKHDWVAGVDKTWNYQGKPRDVKYADYKKYGYIGNIYNPSVNTWPSPDHINPNFAQSDAFYNNKSKVKGWSVMDTITACDDKLTILLGVSGKSIERDKYNSDGSYDKKAGEYKAVNPSYGINYAFSPRLSVFASHTEDFLDGVVVNGEKYANGGEVLDPFKAKQNEFGIKAKTGNFFHKLSYFDITKANTAEKYISGVDKPFLTSDGEQRHKGIEYTATGAINDKWNLVGGFMHLKADQLTSSAATNGKRPNGVPEWTANMGIEYKASEDFSALARANYVGSSYVHDEKFEVPRFFTFDLGVKAKTEFNDTPVTLSAMCYNVADKNYWNASGNILHVGGPRTFMLSAEFEL